MTASGDGATKTITIPGGTAPVHANLQVGFGISPTSSQVGDTSFNVTGTATAVIRDAGSGDTIHSTTITSAHSTLRNDQIVIAANGRFFTWRTNRFDPAQTVTFTCAFSVDYTIDGTRMTSSFNRSAVFTITGEPELFWTGTLTEDQVTNATDAQLQVALTELGNFSSPFTHSYTGAEAETSQTHPCLLYTSPSPRDS